MAKCLPVRLRLHQIHRWLQQEFPPSQPTFLRVTKALEEGGMGQVSRSPRGLQILVHASLPRWAAIDTLLHEWAHVLHWPHIEHSDRWARTYGRIYRRYETTGETESQGF